MYVQVAQVSKSVVPTLMSPDVVGQYVQGGGRITEWSNFVDLHPRGDRRWENLDGLQRRSSYRLHPDFAAGYLLVAKDKDTMTRAFARAGDSSVTVTGLGPLVVVSGSYSGEITTGRVLHKLVSPHRHVIGLMVQGGATAIKRVGLQHQGYFALLTGQMLVKLPTGVSVARVGSYEAAFASLGRHLSR